MGVQVARPAVQVQGEVPLSVAEPFIPDAAIAVSLMGEAVRQFAVDAAFQAHA